MCTSGLFGLGSSGASTTTSAHPLQSTFSVEVQSTANPWSGGLTTPPDPGGGGGGTAAVAIALPAGTTSVSEVSATGSINIDYVGYGSQGPGGLSGTPTQRVRYVDGTSGISGANMGAACRCLRDRFGLDVEAPCETGIRQKLSIDGDATALATVLCRDRPDSRRCSRDLRCSGRCNHVVPRDSGLRSKDQASLSSRRLSPITLAASLSRAESMDPDPELFEEA